MTTNTKHAEQPASETMSVEECLRELREMFPRIWFELSVSQQWNGLRYWIRVYGRPRQSEGHATLTDCMEQVRKWHREQSQQPSEQEQGG